MAAQEQKPKKQNALAAASSLSATSPSTFLHAKNIPPAQLLQTTVLSPAAGETSARKVLLEGRLALTVENSHSSMPCEDVAFCAQLPTEEIVLGVCDGLGGAAGGAVASRLAADSIIESAKRGEGVLAGMREAHSSLTKNKDLNLKGMGTTATVAQISPDGTVQISHIGDCRAYVLSANGVLTLITKDHVPERFSKLAETVDAAGGNLSRLTQEEKELHLSHRQRLETHLGCKDTFGIDSFSLKLQAGEKLLLVSDGISDVLMFREIRSILACSNSAQDAAEALLSLAKSRDDAYVDQNEARASILRNAVRNLFYQEVYFRLQRNDAGEQFCGKHDDLSAIVYVHS